MSRKIKVIELINSFADGGAETLVKDYALNIDKKRFKVYLLTEIDFNEITANTQVLWDKGIRIHNPFVQKRTFFEKVLRKIQNKVIRPKYREQYRAWFIRQFIRMVRPDVIHVHVKMLHYLIPIADELKDVKLYYTCHSLLYRYFNNEDDKAELDAARYLIEHNGLRFVALHEEMRKELNRLFGVDNSIVIRNCVDLNRFRVIDKTKEQVRVELGIPKDAFVLGHVGRFTWFKNQPFLVEVLVEVLKVRNNAFLLLVGDGEKDATLARMEEMGVSSRCMILSHRKDVNIILKAMDVFVFPSVFEGLGIAPIEAQASGLKCYISSNVPKDVFLSENAVMLDLDNGAEQWAKAILNGVKGQYSGDIEDFDVPQVMKVVESLYIV